MSNRHRILIIGLFLYILRYGRSLIRTDHILTDESIWDYVWCLADGHGTEYEQRVWSDWCIKYDISVHSINHGGRETHWIPYIITLYNNRVYILSVFYILVIFTSSLWLAPIMRLSYTPCDPHGNNESSCTIMPNQVWHQVDHHIDYWRHLSLKGSSSREHPYQYRDVYSGYYYTVYRTIDHSYRWLRQSDIIRVLQQNINNTCVCPIFMGIRENITFFAYDDGSDTRQWLIMHRPFVYRNNTMGNKIESTLLYHTHSPLYLNYNNFMYSTASVMSPKQIHYETMYVEYTEVIYDEGICNTSSSLDRIVFDIVTDNVTTQQRRITLTKDDAICFHFCDTTNRLVLDN